jgi:hypothetical protein
VIRGTAFGRARFEEMNEAGTHDSVERRSDSSLQNRNSPLAGSNDELERPPHGRSYALCAHNNPGAHSAPL